MNYTTAILIIFACLSGITAMVLLLTNMVKKENITLDLPVPTKEVVIAFDLDGYPINFNPWVMCIDATCIAVFPSQKEAENFYASIERGLLVKIGDNIVMVDKNAVDIMPEYTFDRL